jgi:hypothetical protein
VLFELLSSMGATFRKQRHDMTFGARRRTSRLCVQTRSVEKQSRRSIRILLAEQTMYRRGFACASPRAGSSHCRSSLRLAFQGRQRRWDGSLRRQPETLKTSWKLQEPCRSARASRHLSDRAATSLRGFGTLLRDTSSCSERSQ